MKNRLAISLIKVSANLSLHPLGAHGQSKIVEAAFRFDAPKLSYSLLLNRSEMRTAMEPQGFFKKLR